MREVSEKGKKVEIYESRVAGFDENVLFFFDGQMECAVKVNSDRRSNINFAIKRILMIDRILIDNSITNFNHQFIIIDLFY